jgi:hypothetical protein
VVVMLTNRVHQVAKRSKFELRPQIHDLIREGFAAGAATADATSADTADAE